MPINPSIPLSVQPMAPMRTPLEQASRVATLRQAQQREALGRQELVQGQLKTDAMVREAQDEAAVRAAFQQYGNDADKILEALYRTAPDAATKFQTFLVTQRTNQVKLLTEQFKLHQTRLETASQLVQGMTPENAATVKQAVAGALGPELAANLPDAPDPNDPTALEAFNQKREAALAWGMKASDYTSRMHYAAQDAMDALTKKGDAAQKWQSATASALSVASSDQEWQQTLGMLKQLGAPASVLGMFPAVWSPENAEKAGAMGLTPQQRATLSQTEVQRKETERHNRELERTSAIRANAAVKAAAGKTILPSSLEPSVISAERPDPVAGNIVDPKIGLTPNAIYQNGIRWALTGQLPALGLSGQGQVVVARMAIQNKGAAIASAVGTDVGTLQAEYKANSAALSKIVPYYQMTEAFAETARKNLALAAGQSARVARTGSPIVNRYVQWATGHTLTGNPELSRFETYIYTASREYAKVTSGAAMSAQGLSDSATRQAQELINAAQTPEAFQATIEAMNQDMANVESSYMERIKAVSGVVGSFLDATRGPAAVTAGTAGRTTPTAPAPPSGGATVRMRAPTGEERDVPADQVDHYKQRGATLIGQTAPTAAPARAKTVTEAQLQALARKLGTSVEDQRRRATAEGFTVVR